MKKSSFQLRIPLDRERPFSGQERFDSCSVLARNSHWPGVRVWCMRCGDALSLDDTRPDGHSCKNDSPGETYVPEELWELQLAEADRIATEESDAPS
jgi:hypothetical protein